MKPPFRADHVGSLLRSAALAATRAQFRRGEVTAAALKATEDGAIRAVVARQESIGLQSITDGELRRDY
jgi:5-methyltetrahydropteroyltriglutamate--homocysteine methyltransferase